MNKKWRQPRGLVEEPQRVFQGQLKIHMHTQSTRGRERRESFIRRRDMHRRVGDLKGEMIYVKIEEEATPAGCSQRLHRTGCGNAKESNGGGISFLSWPCQTLRNWRTSGSCTRIPVQLGLVCVRGLQTSLYDFIVVATCRCFDLISVV